MIRTRCGSRRAEARPFPNSRQGNILRRTLKTVAIGALGGPTAAALGQWLQRDRRLVLAYHNVLPHGEPVTGEASLHLPERVFAEQLDVLANEYEVVSLETLLWHHDSHEHGRHRPRVALTFDDAYVGTLTAGVEQLAARSLPATVFVPCGLLGDDSFWWDAYADPHTGELAPGLREVILNRGARPSDVDSVTVSGGATRHEVGPAARPASEDDLRAACGYEGLWFGSHTWNHVNLPRLPEAEATNELKRPLNWLSERVDRVTSSLSYPFARSSAETERLAARCGYRFAVAGTGGWMDRRVATERPFSLPRLDVPAGLNLDVFRAWLTGLVRR